MNRVRIAQIQCIKSVNRLLCLLLIALLLISTRGNIGFLWMQSFHYLQEVKEETMAKPAGSRSSFLFADLNAGNELGNYSYFVSGMVDPSFNCGLGDEKAADATIIWNLCIEAGVNPAATAAIINNYFGEGHVWQYNGAFDNAAKKWCLAQIEAFNNEEMTPEEFQKTKYAGGASTAFGAWQWLGGRKLNLAKSARNAKQDISSLEFQINFVLCEMGIRDNLTDFDIRGGEWDQFCGAEVMKPKEYAEYFACYFEGYINGGTLASYKEDTAANRSHTGQAQEIYDLFMAAANEYAALHSMVGSSVYDGTVLPADFATKYNIDTTRMTDKRWMIVEKAYEWCESDYMLYSKSPGGVGYRGSTSWEQYDDRIKQKTNSYVDCSWFVHELYNYAGIKKKVPSSSGEYKSSGFKQIDPEDLLAGDVIARDGHVQIFLGWVNPENHSEGYYKASASTNNAAVPDQVLVSVDKDTIAGKEYTAWDKTERAFRHPQLATGNGSTTSVASTSRVNVSSNDGKVREYADCFTRTSVQTTWSADYYDFAMPYNVKIEEIGGIADQYDTKVGTYAYHAYSDSTEGRQPSSFIQAEFGSLSSMPNEWVVSGLSIKKDGNGVETFEWKGKQLYAIALPKCMFPQALAAQGFYAFSSVHKIGILVDLILTDGTVINCVMTDAIGEGHSNGIGEYNGWTTKSSGAAQDGVRYHLTDMKYPQYMKLCHAASKHTVELSGGSTKFTKEYNIGAEDGQNRISYIRVYKYSIRDNS